MDDQNDLQIIRIRDVIKITGLSRAGVYERMAHGGFPKSVSLGGRCVGWLKAEITAWIKERRDVRDSI